MNDLQEMLQLNIGDIEPESVTKFEKKRLLYNILEKKKPRLLHYAVAVDLLTWVTKEKLEMGKSKRKWSFIIGPAIAASLALGIFLPNFITNNPPENPVIRTIEADYIIDTSILEAVVGFSDNVFLGKVIKQVGTKALNIYPESQFEVEVMDNIKGELKGTVKVNQAGGYEGENLFLMENDTLLIEGKTYMFATRYLKEENWHTVIPVGGDIPFNNEKEKKELIEKYTIAYENEIPFKIDE